MKACVTCRFSERKAMQVGPNRNDVQMMYTCSEPDLQDPVEGTPLPCHALRANESFCGISGKKWKAKPEPEAAPKPITESNIIQIGT